MKKARMTKAEYNFVSTIDHLVFTDPTKLVSDPTNTPDPAILALLKDDVVAKWQTLKATKTK